MQLTLTVSNIDPGKDVDIQQIPELRFLPEQNEYWVLLPFFEKVEEATGKLIDLGESVQFEHTELPKLMDLLEESVKEIPEADEELIMQDDGELLAELLEKIKGMINIAILGKGTLNAISSQS